MAKYVITGGQPLKGKIRISGNKNSILPCLAATLLTEEEIILRNVPKIRDVQVSLEILQSLGAETEFENRTLRIKASKIKASELPKDLSSKLRASILFVGSLLARTRKVKFAHPGGDIIGKRSIDSHIEGFKLLGFNVKRHDRDYEASGLPKEEAVEVFLDEASVTATENLALASSLNPNLTVLKNCATEPHVVDLCNLLTLMGVEIDGIGGSTLKIRGAKKLKGADFTIGCDYIEVGTYAVAAAITKGEIKLENCSVKNLEPLTKPLEKMGLQFEEKDSGVVVKAKSIKSVPKLHTNIWPGFPTDVMSLTIVLATQAKGITLCHDWMYEGRMFFVDKLIGMGANITIADPHRVVIYGPSKLMARDLESPDIRAGMAMVLAALIAQGTSTINRAELIERGYENVIENLTSLGAKVERVD